MSELPACHVCGSSSYQKVSGFYVCSNCDTQSQEIQEQLFDYSVNQRVDEAEDREEITIQKVEKERALTSWEIYNLALKRMVEELIHLGASPELKMVAFQIWATYLQKANVAFFSKQVDRVPPLPLGFKSSDAEILYGVENLRKLLYKDFHKKRKKSEYGGGSVIDVDVMSSSSSSRSGTTIVSLKSLRKKQRKVALSELSDSSIHDESLFSHNESLQTLSSDKSTKKKRKTVLFKATTKKMLKNMITAAEKTRNLCTSDALFQKVRNAINKQISNPKRKAGAYNDMVVSFTTVVSVIRLALLLVGDNIQLGDIMRWISEGHITYDLKNLSLPNSKNREEDEIDVKICNRNGFQVDIGHVCKTIDLVDIPTPDLYLLVETYCQELCLPDEFVNYVHGIMNIFQPKMDYSEYHHRIFPNYECRVLGYILFGFKLLFSLDGITERKQSEFADYVNELHSTKSDLPLLFSWNAWVQYIECRKAILSKYNPIINNQAYQGRIDNKKVFAKYWNMLNKRVAVHSFPINPVFIATTTQSLQKIILEEETELDIEFPASVTPQTACTTHLLNNHRQLIEPNARTILESKFTNYSILHLLDHEWCQNIAVTCNVTIQFVEGIGDVAVQTYKEQEEETDLMSISKSTTIPAYAPTKVKVIDDQPDDQNEQCPIPKHQRCKTFKCTFESLIDLEPHSNSVNEFEIYNLAEKYWVFHEFSRSVTYKKFNELSETHFSENFVWLLKELANMISSESRDIYLELVTIEAVMHSLFEEGNYAKTCPFALYPKEW